MRALSLVDIALWDVKGKRAGLPVWRLLGGNQPEVPCILVAGYPTGEPPEALGAKVAEHAASGYEWLKVARTADPGSLKRLLASAAKQLPSKARLIVDAAWWWRNPLEAFQEIRTWADQVPLAWVEDPLVPEDVEGYRRLCATDVAPIGVGDDLTDAYVARALLQQAGISVLRIDAPSIGGITGAWQMQQLAQASGVPVSFHVNPETHVHLAAARTGWASVETFGDARNPFDPAPMLYSGGPSFSPGRAYAPETPGLGFELTPEVLATSTAGN